MSTPFYDLASLVVVPSGYKASKVYAQKPLTTDGQLAFSRASTATRVNSAGLIETVSSNVPRLDYLGSTCPKLLLEGQRSNLIRFSEQIDNAAWSKTSVSVAANSTVSPDGTTNADTITGNGAAGVHDVWQGFAGGTSNSVSFFVKKGSSRYVYLSTSYQATTGDSATILVDLDTQSVVNSSSGAVSFVSSSVVNYGNGWYRITSNTTAASATNLYAFLGISATFTFNLSLYGRQVSTTGETAIFYGIQAEVGAYATSYIPTTTAAVTRLADACSKTGISSLIGQTEGTLFLEMNINKRVHLGGTGPNGLEIKDSSGNNVIMIGTAYATNQIFSVSRRNSGTFSVLASTTNNALGTYKLAAAYSSAGFVFYLNGVQVGTSATLPPSATFADMGLIQIFGTNNTEGELVNQALLFKTRLTNAQLAELTAL